MPTPVPWYGHGSKRAEGSTEANLPLPWDSCSVCPCTYFRADPYGLCCTGGTISTLSL